MTNLLALALFDLNSIYINSLRIKFSLPLCTQFKGRIEVEKLWFSPLFDATFWAGGAD